MNETKKRYFVKLPKGRFPPTITIDNFLRYNAEHGTIIPSKTEPIVRAVYRFMKDATYGRVRFSATIPFIKPEGWSSEEIAEFIWSYFSEFEKQKFRQQYGPNIEKYYRLFETDIYFSVQCLAEYGLLSVSDECKVKLVREPNTITWSKTLFKLGGNQAFVWDNERSKYIPHRSFLTHSVEKNQASEDVETQFRRAAERKLCRQEPDGQPDRFEIDPKNH